MKIIKRALALMSIVLYGQVCYGQVSRNNVEMLPLNLEKPATFFSIPTVFSGAKSLGVNYYPIKSQPSLVFKSPVHYSAFFCKLEVKTMNALGIMLQLHAGDYDSYSGEGRYSWHQP